MATSEDKSAVLRHEHQVRADSIKMSVNSIASFIESFDPERHADQVSIRLEKLEVFYNQYVEEIVQLQLLPASTPEVDYEKVLFRFETKYYQLKAKLTKLLANVSSASGSSTKQHTLPNTHIKYPEINLPHFAGNPIEWRSFHDRYNTAIHLSNALSASEKFQYLKGLLRGEAAGLISMIPISDENYSVAWKRLVNRYDDKRVLIKSHLAELFNTPPMKNETADALLSLVDRFDRNIAILEKLGEPTESWSTILVYQLSSRLESNTLREWENFVARNSLRDEALEVQMPLYSEMVTFLQGHARVLQAISRTSVHSHEYRTKPKQKNSTLHVAENTIVESITRKCPHCPGDHYLYHCFKFRKLNTQQRLAFVKQHRLCLNCLKSTSHGCKDCSSDGCRKCNNRHHTLLHLPSLESNAQSQQFNNSNHQQTSRNSTCSPDSAQQQHNSSVTNPNMASVSVDQPTLALVLSSCTSSQPSLNPPVTLAAHSTKLFKETVLLSTALIYFNDIHGTRKIARVLLDSCSQYNLMTQSFYQRLNLPTSKVDISLGGVGQLKTSVSKTVDATISSRVSGFTEKLKFLVLPTIACDQPAHPISTIDWEIPSWTTLADPTFNTPGSIDALLGAGMFFQLLRYGRITLGPHFPVLQNTIFGWIVSGECSDRSLITPLSQSCYLTHNQRLEQLVTRFWDLEQCTSTSCWSPTEKECERHFVENVQRNEDGRYEVRLPMKQELLPRLRDNRFNAQRRFFSLERKLDANPSFRSQYEDFIAEYLRLGHMREVTQDELSKEGNISRYYLPHHAILRPESTTTQLRTVFDASCKSCSGLSLNDVLLAGPTIQDTLLAIVLRFRMHAFVVTGDIAKMYRQISVHPTDQSLQRIVWRKQNTEPLKTFQLKTVTYGTNCAPFLATRVLQQLAEDERKRYPLAAPVVRKDMYMDDLLTGQDDLKELKELCLQLLLIFESAGMQLRKISSNRQEILNIIPGELREPRDLIEFDSEAPIKTLGLLWEPSSDSLLYKLPKFSRAEKYTKRIILSQTSSFFDPLGLLSPAVVKAKILIQCLWKLDYDWDYPLPEKFAHQWKEYQNDFNSLQRFRLPRHVKSLCRPATIEIHGFSDASEHAYGACIYLRSISSDGMVTIRLIAAKSRIAPISSKSIARLELCASLLLARLFQSVSNSIDLRERVFLWTDSTIVLHWLASSPSTWQTFVANRVAEIQEITSNCTWNHVPSEENPADLISRGMEVGQLLNSSLWWNGPPFLEVLDVPWPKAPADIGRVKQEILEKRQGTVLSVVELRDAELVTRFSSFTTFLRIGALCRRFVNNCRRLAMQRNHHSSLNSTNEELIPHRSGFLTVDELNETLHAIIRKIQQKHFAIELACLQNGNQLPHSSPLRYLNPELKAGLIRVGGRLRNAEIAPDEKNPFVVPEKHPLTRLIAETLHRQQLHCGPQLLLATLRQRFWPLKGRNLVRAVVHSCVTCVKARPRNLSQLMGSLPPVRVTKAYVFENVGVDFAGPFNLRRAGPRSASIKSYVAVYVCMATKAAHLELVSDLTSAAFIASLRRFIARRGRPQNIYCDNATNFVGADRQLRELCKQFMSQQHHHAITAEATSQFIKFHFIPARSPNFGGLWEACVKSMKYHLRRIIGNAFLSPEAFCTVLTQIESCLNSRPITPLSNDPNDLQVLTPGHFLIGRPLDTLPEPGYFSVPENRLRLWERLQKYTQHFWQRWHLEYLTTLQQRYKWTTLTQNLVTGSVVLLKEETLPVMKWSIARVVNVHPGTDGVVRVASVRLPSGTVTKRSVSRLCLLPIEVDPTAQYFENPLSGSTGDPNLET